MTFNSNQPFHVCLIQKISIYSFKKSTYYLYHDHAFRKKRKHFQPTKKRGCRSKVTMSPILKFPEYKVCVNLKCYAKRFFHTHLIFWNFQKTFCFQINIIPLVTMVVDCPDTWKGYSVKLKWYAFWTCEIPLYP